MSANVQQLETAKTSALDQLCVNTIRTLSIDAVQKANSGHPGAPMGLAPVAYVLWDRFLRYSPTNPRWPNRDRVVLSAGHASMLLYSMLHLTGYDLPLSEIERFRQLGSKMSRPPGVQRHARSGDDDWAAGARGCELGGHGDGRALAGRSLQSGRR